MNKYLISGVAVLLVMVGVTIWLYGNARYAAGVSDCERKQAQDQTSAVTDIVKIVEKNEHEARKVTDIDHALDDLGILRTGE